MKTRYENNTIYIESPVLGEFAAVALVDYCPQDHDRVEAIAPNMTVARIPGLFQAGQPVWVLNVEGLNYVTAYLATAMAYIKRHNRQRSPAAIENDGDHC